jgi:molybdate transport system substrate-binding protein
MGLDPAIHGAARTTGVSALCYYPTLMPNPQFVASTARRPLLAGLAAFVFARQAAEAAEPLRLLTSGAFRQAADALAARYERATGEAVSVANETAGVVQSRVMSGEALDVVVATHAGIAALAQAGRVAAASARDLARVGMGLAVRAGVAHPPIATVEEFRQTLLDAASIAYIDPAAGGTSGIAIAGLIGRLGLADALRARTVLVSGGLVAKEVAEGRAQIGLQQMSELAGYAGIEIVGPLPAEIQSFTVYAGAVAAASTRRAEAAALLAALSPPENAAVLREKGMTAP